MAGRHVEFSKTGPGASGDQSAVLRRSAQLTGCGERDWSRLCMQSGGDCSKYQQEPRRGPVQHKRVGLPSILPPDFLAVGNINEFVTPVSRPTPAKIDLTIDFTSLTAHHCLKECCYKSWPAGLDTNWSGRFGPETCYVSDCFTILHTVRKACSSECSGVQCWGRNLYICA